MPVTTPQTTFVTFFPVGDTDLTNDAYSALCVLDSTDDNLTLQIFTDQSNSGHSVNYLRTSIPSYDNCSKDGNGVPTQSYWVNVNHPIHRPPNV